MNQVTLHVFNPWHDMALATPRANYQPPASAVQMARDLAFLPEWIAQEGDAILNLDDLSLHIVGQTSESQVPYKDWAVKPWGWDLVVSRILQKRFPGLSLPSADQLEQIRQLSSRRLAVETLRALREMGPDIYVGESYFCKNLEQIRDGIEKYPEVLMKQLWSSSGKGLKSIRGKMELPLQNWCQKSILMQGGVVLEPHYDRVLDFAMEFESYNGKISFSGYSLFLTSNTGMYTGNILDKTENLEAEILQILGIEKGFILSNLKLQLVKLLSNSISDFYEGPLGVDMMLVRTSKGEIRVHPCVEINLRFNMGHLALLLSKKMCKEEGKRLFRITYFQSPEELQRFHLMHMEEDGYKPLTPILPNTKYLAYVCMFE